MHDHFYTADHSEATRAAGIGYKLEGSLGKIVPNPTDPTCLTLRPIYRNFNGRDHFYTTDELESVNSGSLGYRSEGITGYCALFEGACGATLKMHR